ncbi:MAG: aspartate/glutamate racemase family protein [Clostridiales bacterium]|uniref:aspartate/glutamate racemase family protein n=1 Tax=Clostridium sp. N3C TaxID=1776758 RepID=UPI00092E0245|nr:aspartate/glutamate racemase family protein [Clostridium sp. N3C]NLZ48910.1 aspartate/glutamate racemase family protein [Clostridiales bacterium]SCN24704.1 Asp/Glu/Hydantoin racemase [Clostridium sp. N3C]
MSWQGVIQRSEDIYKTHSVPATYCAGHPIGIIAVDIEYPKLPGNVANATTFDFPVLYKKVKFDIELLFVGSPEIEDQIISAAKELEEEGVRAIVGACGYFAHFQKQVAEAVKVPVFLSSLCQIPLIKLGLNPHQKIAVFAASGEDLNDTLLHKVGADSKDCIVENVGKLESFAPIRWGKTELDNDRLTKDLVKLSQKLIIEHPEIGAILLECSDLPPYACDIQGATGLPVFDFITLINWVKQAVVQKRYFGYF